MADFGALSKLTKKADAVATSASVLVSRSIREIRGEIANLSRELNLAGSADDREKVYQMVSAKMNRLSRQLNRLMVAQNQLAAQAAAKSASSMTGVEIKYSAKRAQAVFEMVTPAQGENLAAVFTDKMGQGIINSLREATVAALREQAVAGGSMKETAAAMRDKWFESVKDGVPHFVDSSGREWNTAAYFQMNVRTNTMRVYNDCLIDDVARETGSDVMRISSGGSDPACECASWEGTLISLTGKTPGLPTYDDAKAGGCFHPNCVHTLEVVDEYADADEIKRAQAHPFDKPDDDADIWEVQDNRKYEIDQAVKMDEQGMTQEQARVAVDRDNLAAEIRAGLIRADAEAIVAKMTDAQVTALCPDGNPPEFVPFKPTKAELADGAKEKWNHGKWGGVVHIDAKATAADILKVCKIGDNTEPPQKKEPPAPAKKAERKTDPVEEQRKADIAEVVTYVPDGKQRTFHEHTFDGCPAHVAAKLKTNVDSVVCDLSDNKAHCEYGTSVVHISRNTDTWGNNPSTLLHECGHAVLNKMGQLSGASVQDKFRPIVDAATRETEAWARKEFGEKWKSACRPSKGYWYKEIGIRIFGIDPNISNGAYGSLDNQTRSIHGNISDILNAATRGVQFYGHGRTYFQRKGEARPLHEIVANMTAVISDPAVRSAVEKVFPETIKAVETIVYGAKS